MPPSNANGKICYIEMPASDVRKSAAFYAGIFGWTMRRRGDGATAFDDATGQVSGAFLEGRAPASRAELLVYIMVSDIHATLEAIVAGGGAIAQPVGADQPEITARFKDPTGNVLGLYQEPTLKGS